MFRNETQFVNWLRAQAGARPADVRIGIGDDAAVVRPRRGFELILKADMSLEGVHFDAGLHPAFSVGHRALARPLSDIAAMGGVPRFALISLAINRTADRRWFADFWRGLLRLARRLRVAIIGGDTAITRDRTFADVVLVGEIERGKALLRSGARPGDLIYTSGRLGLSRLGLEALQSGAPGRRPLSVIPAQGVPPRRRAAGFQSGGLWVPAFAGTTRKEAEQAPLAAELARALRAHLFPEPRVELGRFLARKRLASAAIDISDGLSTDLGHLTEASNVGARIWASLLPAPQSAVGSQRQGRVGGRQSEGAVTRRRLAETPRLRGPRQPAGSLDLALNGGEDYELLFTVPARLAALIPSAYRGVPLHRIGEILRGRGLTLIRSDGAEVPLEPGGFDHFSNPPTDG